MKLRKDLKSAKLFEYLIFKMKIITIVEKEISEEKISPNKVIERIHEFAQANGSLNKVSLEIENSLFGKGISILSTFSVSNKCYSLGYSALLFYLDSKVPESIVITEYGKNCWFKLHIKDIKEFLKVLV